MLTIPKEIVPLQMARGLLPDVSLPRLRGRVGVGALRAVLGAIPNILDSARAVGGLASHPVGGRLPRCVERAAQSVGEPARAGNEGADLGNGALAAARCGCLDRDRPSGAAIGGLAARVRVGAPRADLFRHA